MMQSSIWERIKGSMNWIDLIKDYTTFNEQEKKDKVIVIKCLESKREIKPAYTLGGLYFTLTNQLENK